MFSQAPTTLDRGTLSSPADALARLKRLAPGLEHFDPDSAMEMLPELSTAIGQIVDEHQGMADELVCIYEQLGIIFEVTRKLAGVDDEREVLKLFHNSLSRSFHSRTVRMLAPKRGGEFDCLGDTLEVTPRLRELLDQAKNHKGAVVDPPGDGAVAHTAEYLVSPIFSGDALAAVLVLMGAPGAAAFKASEMLLVESLTKFCGDIIRGHRLVRELRQMSVAMVRSLVSAVDQKDEYTCGHSLRVAHYATALGRLMGLSQVDLQMLQWSGLLHDVGKIGIRDSVLKKEGKLTHEEFAHIKEHPVRSHKVVQQVPQLAAALDGILHHHERFDGTGYPSGLAGEAIPLQARIIQIADVFDALTSNRSYRSAYGWERALQIMNEEAGRTIDPKLCAVFEAWVRRQVGPDGSGWTALTTSAGQAGEELTPGQSETGAE